MDRIRVIPGAISQDSIRTLVLAAGQGEPEVVVRRGTSHRTSRREKVFAEAMMEDWGLGRHPHIDWFESVRLARP